MMPQPIRNNDDASSALCRSAHGTPPRHVAVIMDGNGRWAMSRGLPRTAGHIRGIAAVRRTVRCARFHGIRHLTLFAFSTENWGREAREVSLILRLLERFLEKQTPLLVRHGISLRVIGERPRLPAALRLAAAAAEAATAGQSGMTLTLAISYGGKNEIVTAARELARQCVAGRLTPAGIDEERFEQSLLLPDLPPVDLLIRTGGEQRLSNFLLWQLAYAELVFLPRLWPDFGTADLERCLAAFGERRRRFGREG